MNLNVYQDEIATINTCVDGVVTRIFNGTYEQLRANLARLAEFDNQIREGTMVNLNNIPKDARVKIWELVRKIENEGSGGLICILL